MSELKVRTSADGNMWLVSRGFGNMEVTSVHSDKGIEEITKVLREAISEVRALSPGTPIADVIADLANELVVPKMPITGTGGPGAAPGHSADLAQARNVRCAADYAQARRPISDAWQSVQA